MVLLIKLIDSQAAAGRDRAVAPSWPSHIQYLGQELIMYAICKAWLDQTCASN